MAWDTNTFTEGERIELVLPDGDYAMVRFDVKDLADHCLGMLTPRQGDAARRYYFDGKTMDEVGQKMGVN